MALLDFTSLRDVLCLDGVLNARVLIESNIDDNVNEFPTYYA